MAQQKNLTTQPFHPVSLGKGILQGAAVALTLLIVFLLASGGIKQNQLLGTVKKYYASKNYDNI